MPRVMTRERLNERIAIDPVTGCWNWLGFLHKQGYGVVSYQGTTWRTHRLLYTLDIGPIPPGLFVCHTCDNTSCCNPDHLFLGTHTDNQRDMVAKGRHAKGRKTHCDRGHDLAVHGRVFAGHRKCMTCQAIRQRMRAGWTEEQATMLPKTPPGLRPVNGCYKRTKPYRRIRKLSTSASSAGPE